MHPRVKRYWEIVADNVSKAGWSLGYVSAVDSKRRTIWIADAHRDDGSRFVVRSDEKLTAFLELERVARESLSFSNAEQFDTILVKTHKHVHALKKSQRKPRKNICPTQ
jgi:hypothetical protein